MASLTLNCKSAVLGEDISVNVILPECVPGKAGYPCLYLLHGLSDDHSVWCRRTSIERYAVQCGLAVVMPGAGRSFYTDMKHGPRYWTFVSEELISRAEAYFRISARREDRFAAGLSMGGYGAFKLALRRPDLFCAAASMSGALDMATRGREKDLRSAVRLIWGAARSIAGSDSDLFAVARKLARSRGPKPRFYQCCGTEDFLYPDNLRFRDHAKALGLDLTYEEGPGEHEWGYWDRQIQRVLEWMRGSRQ